MLKTSITTSPCLAVYDSNNPCFDKIDWSATSMGYVLMQLDDSKPSVATLSQLSKPANNNFDCTMLGTWLKPILFRSQRCMEKESPFHSFVREAACGSWAIAHLWKYLWGAHFYWVINCIPLWEFLEYDRPFHQIKCWAQVLLVFFPLFYTIQPSWCETLTPSPIFMILSFNDMTIMQPSC